MFLKINFFPSHLTYMSDEHGESFNYDIPTTKKY